MKSFFLNCFLLISLDCWSWGFFAHQKINYYAVFLLPPEMMILFKPHILFIREHSVDPDKRRYAIAAEGPRHYLDLDHYGSYPFNNLPHRWEEAVMMYGPDSLAKHGIVPWWIMVMKSRLTEAFREKNGSRILKYAAEIGHYIADAHVPLHTNSNHNGQLTGQQGIHGFWESRIPELMADKEWNLYTGKAVYLNDPLHYIWNIIFESSAAADSVLLFEKKLTAIFRSDQKYSFEERNGKNVRQYSSSFSKAYNTMLQGMIERRMRQSIASVASFWYTSWIDAGQPDLSNLSNMTFPEKDRKEFDELTKAWKQNLIKGREE